MPLPAQHIFDLAYICAAKDIENVIISPGSRNAPLIHAFKINSNLKLVSIVDERSAAYFGLGIAKRSGKPVVLVCTSGTAILNYSPALAEALYQNIPLIAVTADRPEEWIDQRNNQTIRQQGVYKNFIKKSFQLPQTISSEDDLWYSDRTVSEAINIASTVPAGPVHINVPLKEPLYGLRHEKSNPKLIHKSFEVTKPDNDTVREYSVQWGNFEKIVIICGQHQPDDELSEVISELSVFNQIIVIAENLSNIRNDNVIACPDLVLASMSDKQSGQFKPELLVTLGGHIVSKRLRLFLRKYKPNVHWHIEQGSQHIDTFQCLTDILNMNAATFLRIIAFTHLSGDSDYRQLWLKAYNDARQVFMNKLEESPFSDLKVFEKIFSFIPGKSDLHLGNSSPVRYSQMFDTLPDVYYFGNRGTSGIDGVLSTAAGSAKVSETIFTTVILGDLSFVYDSNALWNKMLSKKLRIIVINNSGGGIFRLIDGPKNIPGFEEFFETIHPVNLEKLTSAFGLEYYFSNSPESLTKQLSNFYNEGNTARVLEIKTPKEQNETVYKDIFNYLKP